MKADKRAPLFFGPFLQGTSKNSLSRDTLQQLFKSQMAAGFKILDRNIHGGLIQPIYEIDQM